MRAMKAASILCAALLLASCVSTRIKTVPVAKKIIDIEQIADFPTESSSHETDFVLVNDLNKESDAIQPNPDSEGLLKNNVAINDVELADDSDPTEIEKVRIAIKTEYTAKKSLNESISSLTLSIISIVLPFILLASIICFILGIVHYNRANKSQYSTPKAERRLRASRGLLIATGVIYALMIITIGIILAVLFL